MNENEITAWLREKAADLGVNLGVTDGEYLFNARSGGVTGVGKTIALAIENMNSYQDKTREILRQQLAELDA